MLPDYLFVQENYITVDEIKEAMDISRDRNRRVVGFLGVS